MATIIIEGPKGAAAQPLNINGRRYAYEHGKPFDLPDTALESLRNSDLTFTLCETESPAPVASAGNGDAGGDSEPGGQPSAASDTPDDEGDQEPETEPESANDDDADDDADAFDPEEVIKGNVRDVAARLADLTKEQLEAVKAAELDREQPRVGVENALQAALATFGED